MGVFTFVCRNGGGSWTAKQHEGDLESSASSTYELQRKLVQAALSADSSGGVQSSFSLVSSSSAVCQVIVGGAVGGGFSAGGAPSGGNGGGAGEAAAADSISLVKLEIVIWRFLWSQFFLCGVSIIVR